MEVELSRLEVAALMEIARHLRHLEVWVLLIAACLGFIAFAKAWGSDG